MDARRVLHLVKMYDEARETVANAKCRHDLADAAECEAYAAQKFAEVCAALGAAGPTP
jgi:hypothetical protein